jgi:hypothetical protein
MKRELLARNLEHLYAHWEVWPSEEQFSSTVNDIFAGINQTQQILADVSATQDILDYYASKTPRWAKTTIILLSFLTAFLGIFLPMTHYFWNLSGDTSFVYILYAFVPFCCHLIVGGIIFSMMKF